jgi:hypothetical protein
VAVVSWGGINCSIIFSHLLLGVGKLIKQSTLESILKEDKQGTIQLGEMNYFKFTIIEEKRKDHTGSKLVNSVPQVVGEAFAMYVNVSAIQA